MPTNYEEAITMQAQKNRVTKAQEAPPCADERMSLLAEVDFKWLMAGQGWWIDSTRMHRDPPYAIRFLQLAMTSQCIALRDCAVLLQTLMDSPVECLV
ncbi:hypothetical protein ACHMXK_11205 [Polaromonas sp. UC242_47]